MIDLSIIIASRRRNVIDDCLKSLLASDINDIKIEIIVVAIPKIEVDVKEFEIRNIDLKIKKFKDLAKTSEMRNIGVSKSCGKYIVFLDDDTIIPKDWLKKSYEIINSNPNQIICGPNIDNSSKLGYKLADIIQSIFITEGLKTHSISKIRKVDFHNIPLNNCVMDRKIFEKINGFNQEVDWYLDDVEFFYICHKLGYKFMQHSELTIQHYCRKFPFEFLKYKFYARKKIGCNAVFFPELYKDSFIIKIILLSYLVIPVLIYLFFIIPRYIFLIIIGLYFLTIIIFSFKFIIKKWQYIIIPFGIFLTHLVSYFGFAYGIVLGLINFKNYKKIKKIKKNRYAVFNHSNN